MSVVIETTLGDVTVDLFTEERPQTCLNFLKLCKIKYYNLCLFHSVSSNFLAQTGDPTGKGDGGESIFGSRIAEHVITEQHRILANQEKAQRSNGNGTNGQSSESTKPGNQQNMATIIDKNLRTSNAIDSRSVIRGKVHRLYQGEKLPRIKHDRTGLLSMVSHGDGMLGSQFVITLSGNLTSLDQEHCVFGHVVEGAELLLKLNEAITDEQNRPYQDIRITHTVILDDPFPDPEGLEVPPMSPVPPNLKDLAYSRIPADEPLTEKYSQEELDEMVQQREAAARAAILEMVGDIPDADIAPPENVLFVCKLNPVTSDHDLSIIFSRFGTVKSCEVIRDQVTGDSLQYAFVEFEDRKACEDAYFKMDNVLIDDRRIHVDFSQSVAKLKWRGKGRGVEYFGPPPPGGWGNRSRDSRQKEENKQFEFRKKNKFSDRSGKEINSVRNGRDFRGENVVNTNSKKIKMEGKKDVKKREKPRRKKSSSSSSSSSISESSDSSSESSESSDGKRRKHKSSRKVLVVVKTPGRSKSRKRLKKARGKHKRHKSDTESESEDSDLPKKKKRRRRRQSSSCSSSDEAEKKKKKRKASPSSDDEPKSKKRKKKDRNSSNSSSDYYEEIVRKKNKSRKRKDSSCSSSESERTRKRRRDKFRSRKKKQQSKKPKKRHRYDSENSFSSE